MKRVTVQLKQLKPNPYKKDVCGGRIEESVVARIKESASKTSFWEQWVVREKDGEYQMAFGHHRLAAALELYGPKYEVSVQVEPYTDEQMLIALADENSGCEESPEAKVDVIRVARSYLRNHPEACKAIVLSGSRTKPAGGRPHEHGSIDCLLAFLGSENWCRTKIADLVTVADKFDNRLLKDIVNWDGEEITHTVGLTAAVEIAKLDKPSQESVVEAIKEASGDLREFKKSELANREKNSYTCAGVKEMPTNIPSSVIAHAVREASSLPRKEQAQAVVKHIKRFANFRKEHTLDSLRSPSKVVDLMISQLYNFPSDKDMKALVGNREGLSEGDTFRLLQALALHQKRIDAYGLALSSKPQKKLMGAVTREDCSSEEELAG